jgi:predicted metal-dependent hydrolase
VTNSQITLWRTAIEQFNREDFFECHETLEDCWREETDIAHKNLMQGIIHLAVAFFHHRNENTIGYQRQLEKALRKLKYARLKTLEEVLNVNVTGFIKEVSESDPKITYPKISSTVSAASR